MINSKKLIVIAGGTGGHIFPGLAVANYLISQGWEILWLGTSNNIDSYLLSKYKIKGHFIYLYGLRGQVLKKKILAPFYILSALLKSKRIMQKWRPDVVLSMGGYISGPGGLAAWICGIPLVVHEQNRIVGLTNYWLAKIANKVLQAFPGALPNAHIVGNPVRKEIIELPEPSLRLRGRTGLIRILVIGGSQGAIILNKILPDVAAKLFYMCTFWHQVGKGAIAEVQKAYSAVRETQYKIVEFIDDIATAYAWADLVICRSGALTVSELAIVGLPAIFVPFMHKDRQQYFNARLLEQVGAAKIIEQSKFTADNIINIICSLNHKKLLKMAQSARSLAITDSTEKVAHQLITTIK
ncbi:undecaprenyldiphospho-muramoylpentapeptide beta-N-acetylglucosaminyltransferase [Candidatus Palibaumannia cicadellinicola]|uniref:UDP-N-acetylglucosamine--N-acetylmuramyl-(pentapeptide) pyrophosphoryl-undecaprenol N-acetylglucosamine transferase n=1 Tax=Candidatus Palibaumannia cicadellinicola TaxID=186490 RepID=A0A0K2BLJ2_9GAMM|nr:undecaprenyldiphospho-muramoylpentapeptide beta-N-acetylglucosaminyltransferase [Candidatus Baumannia cicadellinicola]AKZ66049.1 UDP-N-acetylglucosamine--N-acetylmuramyl- (pentapeptide) pyrophosphoryl-undecaprenol N-acetylglucosamine transferase [Candidatus Baumannia cicadellinicola]